MSDIDVIEEVERRPRWIRLVPPLLLTGVAIWQAIASATADVSPWVGGGFGMFATVDGDDRVVTIDGVRIGGELARRHAAAPFDLSADRLRDEAGRQRELIVWAPVYDPSTGALSFQPLDVAG